MEVIDIEAERIHVSDKAISKWERGNGCPDISLLAALADVFGTDIRVLLSGELGKQESGRGNMKKMQFYVCRKCGKTWIGHTDEKDAKNGGTVETVCTKCNLLR